MRTIELRSASGQAIELTTAPPPNPYVFVGLDGQGAADAAVFTAQSVLQSGSTALETLLEERSLSVSLLVTGRTRQALDQNILALNRLVNPLGGAVTITYQNAAGIWRIRGILEGGLSLGARTHRPRPGHVTPVTLNFTCCDPFWQGLTQYEDSLRYLSGGFRFPVRCPAAFGVSGYERIIVNAGDTAAPVVLRIRGACSRLTVRNHTANRTLTLTRPLGEFEALTIDTDPLSKSVVLEDLAAGTSRKAFSLIDITVRTHAYWQLLPGENKISCETEAENELVQVSLKWSDRFAGVS
jgi:hypothetical protein